jgi:poly(glycerol-phosphate) alpha-glucosyltransferase
MRHLHFVQSIELAQGGGLGKAALDLHREFLRRREGSTLLTTLGGRDMSSGDHVLQFRRKGPEPLFYAPDLARAARELMPQADVVHGHGFYVYPNFAVGRRARRRKKPLVYHPHGMLEPYILARSRWKKTLAHLLFEDANFRKARLWRALTLREADQIRAAGVSVPIVIAPNGVHLDEFDAPDTASLPLAFPAAEDAGARCSSSRCT